MHSVAVTTFAFSEITGKDNDQMRRLMLIALSVLAALASAAPALAGEHWDKYQNHNETFLRDEN